MKPVRDKTPGFDVSSAITDGMIVHKNLQQEIVFTTVDKLKICLMEGKANLQDGKEWIGAAGLAVSLITTLVAAEFRDAGLKAPTWQALYILASLASLVWTGVAVIQAVRVARSGGLSGLITKIINKTSTLSTGAITYEQLMKAMEGIVEETPWPSPEEPDQGGV